MTDLLVVDGGTAGIVGTKTADRSRARTVLMEVQRTGEDCLWTGCVPSKTLLPDITHSDPTYSHAVWNTVIAHARFGLESRFARTAIGVLSGVVAHSNRPIGRLRVIVLDTSVTSDIFPSESEPGVAAQLERFRGQRRNHETDHWRTARFGLDTQYL